MQDFLIAGYPWIKSLHILAVISWMAALLYLPRLMVYHAERGSPGSELSETLKIMERKLLNGIMTPAMLASWLFGLALALTPGIVTADSGWFLVKLLALLLMTGMHMWFAKRVRVFAEDRNELSGLKFRFLNEGPALLMVLIVVMVVVKPF